MDSIALPLLDPGASEWLWTLAGRIPVALLLLGLTLLAHREVGSLAAVIGLSGFCAGAVVGTAALPSILGALGGGTLGAAATWWVLRVPLPSPGLPTAAMVALMAVGRWGCVLCGCCFGVLSSSPLAIRYARGSLAHGLHHALGLVPGDASALPVVPVQALESVAFLALLALALVVRRRFRSEGAWSLVLVSGVLGVRAALDPLRAMVNTASSVRQVGPLSAFQWGALGLAALCLACAVVLQLRTSAAGAAAARAAKAMPAGRDVLSTTPRPALASPSAYAGVWALQALGAAAVQVEGTPLLRALALASLGISGAWVASAASSRSRLSWALAGAALLLLVPRALLAEGDSNAASAARAWVYGVHPSGKLVRLGPGGSSPEVLTSRFLALAQPVDAEPPTPPPLESAPPPPADEVPPAPADAEAPARTPAARRRSLGVTLLGGQEVYTFTTCNGSGGNAVQQFGELQAQYEQEEERSAFQLHGRLLMNHTVSQPAMPAGVLGGGFIAGGLYEWRWQVVSLGVGGSLGVASPGALYPISLVPVMLGSDVLASARFIFWPIFYLRVEAIRGWAFEIGTGSRYQPDDGPFLGFRFGSDAPDGIAVRVGGEMTWLPYLFNTPRLYLGVGFLLAPSYRLELRAMGRPPESNGVPFSAAVRLVHEF